MSEQTAPINLKTFEEKSSVCVPLWLAKSLGLKEAFLFCYLLGKRTDAKSTSLAITVSAVERETGVNEYYQRAILKKLRAMGLLGIRYEGNAPKKRIIHFGVVSLDEIEKSLRSAAAVQPRIAESRAIEK